MKDKALNEQYSIKRLIGEGSFSTIYSAFDNKRKENVALKVEKAGKPKRILLYESQILQRLQGFPHVGKFYELVRAEDKNALNFMVMELLGKNLSVVKQIKDSDFTAVLAIRLLLQMLDAIEVLHNQGYVHCDIKPGNFALGIKNHRSQVYIIDFGLVKQQRYYEGVLIENSFCDEFKGTLRYASVNAHRRKDLSWNDDMWSFYFVVLEFLNQSLPWTLDNQVGIEEIITMKATCLANPAKYLWTGRHTQSCELMNIFNSIQQLTYLDRPDYKYIHQQLSNLLEKEKILQIKADKLYITPMIHAKKRRRRLTKEESKGLLELSHKKIREISILPRKDPIPFSLKMPPISVLGLEADPLRENLQAIPMQKRLIHLYKRQLNTLMFYDDSAKEGVDDISTPEYSPPPSKAEARL